MLLKVFASFCLHVPPINTPDAEKRSSTYRETAGSRIGRRSVWGASLTDFLLRNAHAIGLLRNFLDLGELHFLHAWYELVVLVSTLWQWSPSRWWFRAHWLGVNRARSLLLLLLLLLGHHLLVLSRIGQEHRLDAIPRHLGMVHRVSGDHHWGNGDHSEHGSVRYQIPRPIINRGLFHGRLMSCAVVVSFKASFY